MYPAVFLDRDNTLIHNDEDLGDPAGLRLIQGAASAVASLCGLGYKVVVVTNQGGVARGKYKEEDVDRVHARLAELLHEAANGARIDAFYYCPYHPEGKVAKYKREHPHRKPQPGMLLAAAEELRLDLKRSWTIGDQVRDVQAGAAAGTRTILLRPDADQLTPLDIADLIHAHDESKREDAAGNLPSFYARSLVEAVRIIAQQRKPDADPPPARLLTGERRWDAAAVAQLQRESRPKPAQSPPAPAAITATRPFRPWSLPPQEATPSPPPPPPEAGSPPPKSSPPQHAYGLATPDAAPPEAGSLEGSSASSKVVPPPAPRPKALQEAVGAADPIEDGEASPTASAGSEVGGASPQVRLLRQILQELRAQRGSPQSQPFGAPNITAMVLQTLAAVCLLGGLWMGAADNDLLLRWGLAALIAQGATIALLLFTRRTG